MLTDVSYRSPAGLRELYAPYRSTPYPTVYLSPGYGANEVDWSTRADAGNILDNLIDKGKIEPMVVVMTNFVFTDCLDGDATAYAQNLPVGG